MGKLEEKKEILQQIQAMEGAHFEFDESAILAEYKKGEGEKSSFMIKVLSIFGGILASLAFLGFLMILGLYESEMGMLFFGIAFIIAAIWLSIRFDKLLIDTLSVCLYVLGVLLFVFALFSLELHEDAITMSVMGIALLTLSITENYILSFMATLTMGGGLLLLIVSNDLYDTIQGYIIVYAIFLVTFFLAEAKLITSSVKMSKLYDPLRIGLIFSFLFGLIALGKNDLVPISHNGLWISSSVIILTILYLIWHVIYTFGMSSKTKIIWIYILSAITLLPTLFAPAIAGALLIVLLSFRVNYKTGLAIGIIALVYFVIQYYYDLNFTLLAKSIMLFSSGIVFLLFYVFLTKKIDLNEKV